MATTSDLRTTVFVGNLAVFCTESDVHELFSTCGEVVEIRIAKSDDNSKHLAYGFVKYNNVASAQIAIKKLDGAILCGRTLKVNRALSRSNKASMAKSPLAFNSASVHLTFICHQITNLITEETLRQLCSEFGPVSDVIISKYSVDQTLQKQSGYGFVHFPFDEKGILAAFRTAEALCDTMIDSVNYKCKISHDLQQRMKFGPSATGGSDADRGDEAAVSTSRGTGPASHMSCMGGSSSASDQLDPSMSGFPAALLDGMPIPYLNNYLYSSAVDDQLTDYSSSPRASSPRAYSPRAGSPRAMSTSPRSISPRASMSPRASLSPRASISPRPYSEGNGYFYAEDMVGSFRSDVSTSSMSQFSGYRYQAEDTVDTLPAEYLSQVPAGVAGTSSHSVPDVRLSFSDSSATTDLRRFSASSLDSLSTMRQYRQSPPTSYHDSGTGMIDSRPSFPYYSASGAHTNASQPSPHAYGQSSYFEPPPPAPVRSPRATPSQGLSVRSLPPGPSFPSHLPGRSGGAPSVTPTGPVGPHPFPSAASAATVAAVRANSEYFYEDGREQAYGLSGQRMSPRSHLYANALPATAPQAVHPSAHGPHHVNAHFQAHVGHSAAYEAPQSYTAYSHNSPPPLPSLPPSFSAPSGALATSHFAATQERRARMQDLSMVDQRAFDSESYLYSSLEEPSLLTPSSFAASSGLGCVRSAADSILTTSVAGPFSN